MSNRIVSRIRLPRWPAVIASGALLGLSYPPFPFPALAWAALVPLLLLWMETDSARRAWIDAFVAFLLTFGIAFQWPLFHAMPTTAWLSLPGLIIIPLWMAAPFGLSAHVRRRVGPAAGLITLLAVYVLMEFSLRRGPLAFPWSLLGHTQAGFYPVNQLASIGGVPLLTLFVLLVNGTLLAVVGRSLLKVGAIMGTLSVGLIGLSLLVASTPNRSASESHVRMSIVQPAISATAWADVYDTRRLDSLLVLSGRLDGTRARSDPSGPSAPREAADRIDLVLWPETALPPLEQSRERVRRWVDSSRVPILSGAILESSDERVHNAALLFRPDLPLQVYRKERLVPFAEGVPFEEHWPWLRRLAVPSGGIAGYAAGSGNTPMEIPDARVGVLICFESLFDDAVRAYARSGTRAVVTLTQDGWWGDSFGYRQHAEFNRLRAIESGLPMVQASVSGISGIIRPDGRIDGRLGWMDRGVQVVSVPQRLAATPYVRFGDWVSVVALGTCLLSCLAVFIHRDR